MAEELTRRQLKLPRRRLLPKQHAPTLFAKIWALLRSQVTAAKPTGPKVFEAFMDPDEAEEYLDYNLVGAWMGEHTPAGADGAARIANS
jgi:hypothetical protein